MKYFRWEIFAAKIWKATAHALSLDCCLVRPFCYFKIGFSSKILFQSSRVQHCFTWKCFIYETNLFDYWTEPLCYATLVLFSNLPSKKYGIETPRAPGHKWLALLASNKCVAAPIVEDVPMSPSYENENKLIESTAIYFWIFDILMKTFRFSLFSSFYFRYIMQMSPALPLFGFPYFLRDCRRF